MHQLITRDMAAASHYFEQSSQVTLWDRESIAEGLFPFRSGVGRPSHAR